MILQGFILDIYHFEDDIYVWILDDTGRAHLVRDRFHPSIYAAGPETTLRNFVDRLQAMNALAAEPRYVLRTHFYKNEPQRVLEIKIARPSVLRRVRRRLYAFYGRLDVYHSDIEVPTAYMYAKNVHPFARVRLETERELAAAAKIDRIAHIEKINTADDLEYELPPLRILTMRLARSHRLPFTENTLIVEGNGERRELPGKDPRALILELNAAFDEHDPDIVLSSYGDQTIFPYLFETAQRRKLPLKLDRDAPFTARKILRKGHSFNTYGSWIYVAPAYPLFGRLHVDSANSFVYKEAELIGVIELARLSCIPVQRMSRSSTGAALTSIETKVALDSGYLVPWQKSAIEEPKNAYELLSVDKGGIQFVPDVRESCVRENTAQLDFSQMYPSIMTIHNISPETVNCSCCTNDDHHVDRVPEAGYRVCTKRRGVVSEALERILTRRAYYKQRKNETEGPLREVYDAMQRSIKWMLVTSFGYLGYRNAKFGRIESHESVTAWGREKLLTAKERAEERGYRLAHGITDSIFIHHPDETPIDREDLNLLCLDIKSSTRIDMAIEGVYSWVVFLPSKSDPELGVINRYFGRFDDGEIKIRGVAARRKDTPDFLRNVQLQLLDDMSAYTDVEDLRAAHPKIRARFEKFEAELAARTVPARDLMIRRKVTRPLEDYAARSSATVTALSQIRASTGVELQPGDKIRYLAVNHRHRDPARRYVSEEALDLQRGEPRYDVEYYRRLLWEVYREVWEHFAPPEYFARKPGAQMYLEF